MKHITEQSEVHNYLAALEARLANVPAEQSEEILFGVREHITEALARGEQSVTEVLTSLGSPDDVLAEVVATGPAVPAPAPAPAPSYRDSALWVILTVVLLPFGGFLIGIGWLLGVAGLWAGTRWKLWEKIVGTALFPGGLAGVFYFLSRGVWESSSGPVEAASDFGPAEPIIPIMSLVATSLTLALPLPVAVYLLLMGLIRRPHRQ